MTGQISDGELEIMKLVWASPGETVRFPELMEGLAARGRPCQKNTLIVLLSRLVNKGCLSATKTGRRNEYRALVTEREYQTAQTQQFLKKVYQGSVRGLVANLVEGDLLSEGEYAELRALLEEGKKGS